jgi:hypothetical protein
MQTILSKKAYAYYLITGQIPPMGGAKGGGGGGGQSTNTVQKADPWAGQQPFLTSGFEAAENRYNSDQPNFFPGNTVAPFNANELGMQQGVVDYTTGARPAAMSFGAENALTGEMLANPYSNPVFNATRGLGEFGQGALQSAAGFTGTPIGSDANASPMMQQMLSGSMQQNPFIGQAINSFANDAVGNFQEQVMPALRASQVAYQPGGSSRGDIAGGIAAGNVGRSIADFANQSRMDAFNSAQQQQMGAAQLMEQSRGQRAQEALGQAGGAFNPALGGESLITSRLGGGLGAYPTVAQAPIDMMTSLGDIGYSQREMTQQGMDEDINRYQFGQNVEDQKLQNYMNLIQGNYGGTTTASAERGGLGLAGQLGQGVGGLAALGGIMGL